MFRYTVDAHARNGRRAGISHPEKKARETARRQILLWTFRFDRTFFWVGTFSEAKLALSLESVDIICFSVYRTVGSTGPGFVPNTPVFTSACAADDIICPFCEWFAISQKKHCSLDSLNLLVNPFC